jgi:hypothetical protein
MDHTPSRQAPACEGYQWADHAVRLSLVRFGTRRRQSFGLLAVESLRAFQARGVSSAARAGSSAIC